MAFLEESCSSFVGLLAKAACSHGKHQQLVCMVPREPGNQHQEGSVRSCLVCKERGGWVLESSRICSTRLCHSLKSGHKM